MTVQTSSGGTEVTEAELEVAMAVQFAELQRERGNVWPSGAPEPLLDIARAPDLMRSHGAAGVRLARRDLCRDPADDRALVALVNALIALGDYTGAEKHIRRQRALGSSNLEVQLQQLRTAFLSGCDSLFQRAQAGVTADRWLSFVVREVSCERWASLTGARVAEIAGPEVQDLTSVRVFNGELRKIGREHRLPALTLAEAGPGERATTINPYFTSTRAGLVTDHPYGDNLELLTPYLLARDHQGRALIRLPDQMTKIDQPLIVVPAMNNYCHWLIESIPSLLTKHHFLPERGVAITCDEKPWMRELLDLAGVPSAHPMGWLPAPFDSPAPMLSSSPISELACHSAAISLVREKIGGGIPPAPGAPKRLFLGRKHQAAGKRVLLNEDELSAIAERYGFVQIYPEKMSVAEQIGIFAGAEAIVGPSGAAFANMIFSPEGAKVMVMTQIGTEATTFASIARTLGQEMLFCSGWPAGVAQYGIVNRNFLVRPEDFELALKALLDGTASR